MAGYRRSWPIRATRKCSTGSCWRPEKAIPYYQRAIDLGFANPSVRLYLAQNYLKTGQKKQAETLLREISASAAAGDAIREKANQLLKSM